MQPKRRHWTAGERKKEVISQLRVVVIANKECMDWQVYLAKAKNDLHTAQSAYAQGDFDSCTSRAYFAVFHTEIAALIKLTAFRQDRWGHDVSRRNSIASSSALAKCSQPLCSPSIMI
jgi:hypothetical protein